MILPWNETGKAIHVPVPKRELQDILLLFSCALSEAGGLVAGLLH
jgi:hypothetical protein